MLMTMHCFVKADVQRYKNLKKPQKPKNVEPITSHPRLPPVLDLYLLISTYLLVHQENQLLQNINNICYCDNS